MWFRVKWVEFANRASLAWNNVCTLQVWVNGRRIVFIWHRVKNCDSTTQPPSRLIGQFIPSWTQLRVSHNKRSFVFSGVFFFRWLGLYGLRRELVKESRSFINVKLGLGFVVFLAVRLVDGLVVECWCFVKLIWHVSWTCEIPLCAVKPHTLLVELFAGVEIEVESHCSDSDRRLLVNFPIFFFYLLIYLLLLLL